MTYTSTGKDSKTTTNTVTYTSTYSRASGAVDKLEKRLDAIGVTYSYTDPNAGSFWSYLVPIICVGLAIVALIFIMRASGGGTKGAMNFAKTNAKMNTNVKTRFSDVAGAEEEKEELKEIVDFLKSPKKFSELGARIPKGVLLVGPPGTGKTLFAKAVAGEAGVPFFSISGSDFVEMFVGVGASRVRDLFDVAKRSMPCIVFIDEIDAVGRQRGTGLGGGNDEKEQTLNQLLVEMDGFNANDGIIIMAATNRADILDPALMRPGRFDRQIYVNMPDVKGREAILKVHARNKPLAKDVNLKAVARMTAGFSGSDLENLLNEAAIIATRENKKEIGNKDLFEGVNKVMMGPAKRSRLVTETDKRITAYHESGHAILAKLLPNCDPVHEVTIVPRGQAAGFTMTLPDNDDSHILKNKLLDDIVMSLGGRVAEEIIIKDVSAGASGDIQAVTKRARLMVTEWGMSEKVGLINYGSDKEVFIGRDMASHVTYSEQTAALIDSEIKRIVDEALAKARKLLNENKQLLDVMARVLIERETIYGEEVNLIMEGKSAEDVIAFMDENEGRLSENPFERNVTTAPVTDEIANLKETEKSDTEKTDEEEFSKDSEKSESGNKEDSSSESKE
ncbi:MAG: ATP-dependent zinc metalloprotease FtsH [Clostridia bacterium]|nr:ATP-dependent zinc metalloprotease FtsH [Clostridia bacterium]